MHAYNTHEQKKKKNFKLESHKVAHDYNASTYAAEAGQPQVPGQPRMQHETLSQNKQKYFKIECGCHEPIISAPGILR